MVSEEIREENFNSLDESFEVERGHKDLLHVGHGSTRLGLVHWEGLQNASVIAKFSHDACVLGDHQRAGSVAIIFLGRLNSLHH